MISHQSKLLDKIGNSFYSNEFVKKKSSTVSSEGTNGSQRGGDEIDWAKTAEKCSQEHCN